jgi:hypothetical protein
LTGGKKKKLMMTDISKGKMLVEGLYEGKLFV